MSLPTLPLTGSAAGQVLLRSLAALALTSVAVSPRLAGAASPCDAQLAVLAAAAHARGYDVDVGGDRLVGHDDAQHELVSQCDGERFEVSLRAFDGSAVHVELSVDGSASAVNIRGEFPSLGSVSRTWIVNDTTAASGLATFTATAGTHTASVEFDLVGESWTATGEAARVSAALAPALASSKIWVDGHRFAFAFGGVEEAPGAGLGLALPVPGITADKDLVDALKVCGAATATCGLALWFPPVSGACAHGTHICLASAACVKIDCNGDG